MTRRPRIAAGVLAALFLALHLPFLPASLEDLDSINFALGVRTFDVTRHQPHPPGYPVFVLAGKAVHLLVPSEAAALALVGVAAGTLSVFALLVLFRRIDGDQGSSLRPIAATLLAATTPLYWFTASRPLSDMAGLAAALAIQGAALSTGGGAGLVAAAFAAGVATGIRSQVAWLTVPVVLFVALRSRHRNLVAPLAAMIAGGLVWAVPLVWLTGGPAAYWRVLFAQGAEDLSGVTMLWTSPTVRQLARALLQTFVAPWGSLWMAGVMLAAADVGAVRLGSRQRYSLVALSVAFGPYLVFHLLFQETATTRYALPVVVPLAFLAASGLDVLPWRSGIGAAIVVALVAGGIGEQALRGYSSAPAPVFRMLADMNGAGGAGQDKGAVLAMHRREEFDLRRPIEWTASGSSFPDRLKATPKHEWLELVKYWNGGGRDPIWFIADPLRSDLALVSHGGAVGSYRWSFEPLDFIGGIRPGETDWYVLDPPAWYLGEGWALTPETSGVAREDGRGPSRAPITGWIRRLPSPLTLMIGGRNLSGPSATVRVAIDGRLVEEFPVAPGFFLKMITLPEGRLQGDGPYAPITIASAPGASEVVVEQFDAKPKGRVVVGYGEGWHEQEYDPPTGRLWRWTSGSATLKIRSEPRELALGCTGVTETFSQPSHVVVRIGDRVLIQTDAGRTFSWTTTIPSELIEGVEAAVTIETDQTYAPADRSRRSQDKRRLGLKIYECRVTPVVAS